MNKFLWIIKEELRLKGLWRNKRNNRKDLKEITIQKNASLLTYWKKEKIGTGPTVTLLVMGREIIRYDCFGEGKGHYHIFPNDNLKIQFVEKTVHEQINRSILDIKSNFSGFLKGHHIGAVRKFNIDPLKLETALDKAREMLNEFAKNI